MIEASSNGRGGGRNPAPNGSSMHPGTTQKGWRPADAEGQRSLIAGFAAAGLAVAACLAAAGCASSDPWKAERTVGSFYGTAKGTDREQAEEQALRALLADARGDVPPPTAAEEATYDLAALGERAPAAAKKEKDGWSAIRSIGEADWAALERDRMSKLRADLGAELDALRTRRDDALVERLSRASRLERRIADLGQAEKLTEREGGTLTFSEAIRAYCADAVRGLRISVGPDGVFLFGEAEAVAAVSDIEGKPVAGLPLRAVLVEAGSEGVSAAVSTGPDGTAAISIPAPREEGVATRLEATADFEAIAPGSACLRGLAGKVAGTASVRRFASKDFFARDELDVPAGEYAIGAAARDARATKAEAPRKATLAAFRLDRRAVTNRLFGFYLEDARVARSAYPEYWGHPDFDDPDQPTVGVSAAQAEAFAAWLSSRLGYRKRLPTEAEWEAAARGGLSGIYPWGDEAPSLNGPRANYRGNGVFDGPSPAGSFPAGTNGYGLEDMAGNVWEWTSTPAEAALEARPGALIVKGGSWMDGQLDLRVSYRKALEPIYGYADVGFRLARDGTGMPVEADAEMAKGAEGEKLDE